MCYGKFELWEYDERTWTKLIGKNSPTPENFGNTDNFNISTMVGYNGRLYLGVNNNQTGFKVFQSSFPEIVPTFQTAAVNTVDLLRLTEGMQPSKWTSSNPAIATIDPVTGYFKAVAPGTSVISASDDRGFTVASRQITVTQGEAPKKDALLIYARFTPPSTGNDGSMPVKATAMPYLVGNAGTFAQARIDLSEIGGAMQDMFDDGTHGDAQKNDGVFTCEITIPKNTKARQLYLPCYRNHQHKSQRAGPGCSQRKDWPTRSRNWSTSKPKTASIIFP